MLKAVVDCWSAGSIGYGRTMLVDFTQPSWEPDRFPGRHLAPVGAQAGSEELAVNVYELDPGVVGSPWRVQHANEELLLVLAGTLSLARSGGDKVPFRRRGGRVPSWPARCP